MKKLFVAMFLILSLVLVSNSAFAAVGSISGTATKIYNEYGKVVAIKVALTCTAGSGGDAGAFPTTVINTLSGLANYNLIGTKLNYLQIFPGAVAPTDASDLTFLMNGVDILGTYGTNKIDATDYTSVEPGTATASGDITITDFVSVAIANNLVESAIVYINATFLVE